MVNYNKHLTYFLRYHTFWYEDCDDSDHQSTEPTPPLGVSKPKTDLPTFPTEINPASIPSIASSTFSTCAELTNNYMFILMEFCNGGTLANFLATQSRPRIISEIPKIFTHLSKGLAEIHRLSIIHRDLKPNNIFCSKEYDWSDSFIWKIGDFGLSTRKGLDEEVLEEHEFSQGGQHIYQSPEMERGEPYDEKSDVYSLGLIFMELILYSISKDGTTKGVIQSKLKEANQLSLTQICDPTISRFESIVKEMIDPIPSKRPSANQVFHNLVHPLKFHTPKTKLFEGVAFSGREIEMEILQENFTQESKDVSLIFLDATAGSGRTEFLLQFLKSNEPNINTIWLQGGHNGNYITEDVLSLASELDVVIKKHGRFFDVDDKDKNERTIWVRIFMALTEINNYPIVIIIDDVHELCKVKYNIELILKAKEAYNELGLKQFRIFFIIVTDLSTSIFLNCKRCKRFYQRLKNDEKEFVERVELQSLWVDDENGLEFWKNIMPSDQDLLEEIGKLLRYHPVTMKLASIIIPNFYREKYSDFIKDIDEGLAKLEKISYAYWTGFIQDKPPFFICPAWTQNERILVVVYAILYDKWLEENVKYFIQVLSFLDLHGVDKDVLFLIVKRSGEKLNVFEEFHNDEFKHLLATAESCDLVRHVQNGNIILRDLVMKFVQLDLIESGKQKVIYNVLLGCFDLSECGMLKSFNYILRETGATSSFVFGPPIPRFSDFRYDGVGE